MTHLMCSFFRRSAGLILLVVGGFAAGLRAETPNVAGKMPEDSIPVLKTILETAAKQSPTMILKAIQIEQAETGKV